MPEVVSSAILAIDHDGRDTLFVTFVSGRLYAYAGISPRLYTAFLRAPSKGTFFNDRIRDAFAHVEITARSIPGPRSSA